MSMSSGYGPPADQQAMISLIRTAVDRNGHFTPRRSAPFTNEEPSGSRPVRDQVAIATKFASPRDRRRRGLTAVRATKQSVERARAVPVVDLLTSTASNGC
jgi:hypothetical protein